MKSHIIIESLNENDIRQVPGCPGCIATRYGSIIQNRQKLDTLENEQGRLYVLIEISKGRTDKLYVDYAVLNAFFGPAPSRLLTPMHKDNDPRNNIIDNLEWATQQIDDVTITNEKCHEEYVSNIIYDMLCSPANDNHSLIKYLINK